MLRRIIKPPPGEVIQRQLLAQSIPLSSVTSKVNVTISGPALTSMLTLSISMLFKTGGSDSDPLLETTLLFDFGLDCLLAWLFFQYLRI